MALFKSTMLDSKHERLVRRCYPPGKGIEKHPQPSELSYLMYYVTSRRARIPRVSEFVCARALRYLARNKTGNAIVSLEILLNLIERCGEDISVFARQVIHVLTVALASQELLVLDVCSQIFEAFCDCLTPTTFSGDPDLSEGFKRVVQQLSAIAHNDSAQSRALRLLSTRALASVSGSPGRSSSTGSRAYQIALGALLDNLPVETDGELLLELAAKADSNAAARQSQGRKSSEIQPRRAADSEKSGRFSETALLATEGVRHAFDNGTSELVTRATETLAKIINDDQHSRTLEWTETLFALAAHWCPVQHRFVIVTTLCRTLRAAAAQNTGPTAAQSKTVKIITSLLSSKSVSMVGLSVVDFMRKLVDLQHTLVKLPTQGQKEKELIMQYRVCVATLAKHIIYPGQAGDMVSELLMRYSHGQNDDTNAPTKDTPSFLQNFDAYIECDMTTALAVLQTVPFGTQIPLNGWIGTQWLLTRQSVCASEAYAIVFVEFLKKAHSAAAPQSPRGALVFKQLSEALVCPSNGPANFAAVACCFTAIARHLGKDAMCLVPWLLRLLKIGTAAGHEELESKLSAELANISINLNRERGLTVAAVALLTLREASVSAKRSKATERIDHSIRTRQKYGGWWSDEVYEAIKTKVLIPEQLIPVMPALIPVSSIWKPNLESIPSPDELDLVSSELEWALDQKQTTPSTVDDHELNSSNESLVFKPRGFASTMIHHSDPELASLTSARSASLMNVPVPHFYDLQSRLRSSATNSIASKRVPSTKLSDLMANLEQSQSNVRGSLLA